MARLPALASSSRLIFMFSAPKSSIVSLPCRGTTPFFQKVILWSRKPGHFRVAESVRERDQERWRSLHRIVLGMEIILLHQIVFFQPACSEGHVDDLFVFIDKCAVVGLNGSLWFQQMGPSVPWYASRLEIPQPFRSEH